jgi:hypothetical protein
MWQAAFPGGALIQRGSLLRPWQFLASRPGTAPRQRSSNPANAPATPLPGGNLLMVELVDAYKEEEDDTWVPYVIDC